MQLIWFVIFFYTLNVMNVTCVEIKLWYTLSGFTSDTELHNFSPTLSLNLLITLNRMRNYHDR